MISSSGTLARRVTALVTPHWPKDKPAEQIYGWVDPPGPFIVREVTVTGKAEVEVSLPQDHEYLGLRLPTGLFHILKSDKNADGVLLAVLSDGKVEAHVFECKKNVTSTTWGDALEQMTWTLVKVRALAGALGMDLSGAVFYTAFRGETLSEKASPNPAAGERIVGPPEGNAEADLDWGRRKQLYWVKDALRLAGFEGAFAHRKIQLDATGSGVVTLAVGAR